MSSSPIEAKQVLVIEHATSTISQRRYDFHSPPAFFFTALMEVCVREIRAIAVARSVNRAWRKAFLEMPYIDIDVDSIPAFNEVNGVLNRIERYRTYSSY